MIWLTFRLISDSNVHFLSSIKLAISSCHLHNYVCIVFNMYGRQLCHFLSLSVCLSISIPRKTICSSWLRTVHVHNYVCIVFTMHGRQLSPCLSVCLCVDLYHPKSSMFFLVTNCTPTLDLMNYFPAGTWRWNNVKIKLKHDRYVVPNWISASILRIVPLGCLIPPRRPQWINSPKDMVSVR